MLFIKVLRTLDLDCAQASAYTTAAQFNHVRIKRSDHAEI